MLELGEASSMKEIARRGRVDDSYVSRMVNLTTLAGRAFRWRWQARRRLE
jgi:hypothetical protein